MPLKVCASLVAFCLSFAGAASQATCEGLTVSAPPEYPPFSYTNANGLNGAGIEISKLLAAEIGVPITVISHASWARVYQRHLEGRIDLVGALYRTPEREEMLHFIGSYAEDRSILVAPKAKPVQYSSLNDLIPLKGVIVNGDSRGMTLDSFIRDKLNVIKVHSFVNVESLLKAGRVDYALVGEFSPKVTAFDYRAPESNLYAVDPPLTKEPVYVSLSRQSPCAPLIEALRQAFEKIATEEVRDTLLARHSGMASGRAIRQNR